jgi:hypothetical protein
MRSWIAILVICFSVSVPLQAHSSRHTARPTLSDPGYSEALAAANRFLHAWQTQDHEAGIMMLSDAARQQVSPEKLQDFFAPAANAAFEIQRGRKLAAGAYSFPVVLFGLAGAHDRAHSSKIAISKVGKDDWAVEKLP